MQKVADSEREFLFSHSHSRVSKILYVFLPAIHSIFVSAAETTKADFLTKSFYVFCIALMHTDGHSYLIPQELIPRTAVYCGSGQIANKK